MNGLREEYKIQPDHGHFDDAKTWLEEDLNIMVSNLPYLKHMFGVEVVAKGLRRR
jgi:hypothetical protein